MIRESKVKPDEEDPYLNEWSDLVDAIRTNRPYNEVNPHFSPDLCCNAVRPCICFVGLNRPPRIYTTLRRFATRPVRKAD